ncbi:MAG: ribulose-phosphate 3-epimerase [Candidatus Enterosoma sp.]|nr:ribulose-phosphate 3-epimerase [Bacilli bacterium]MDY3907523.1 ribulose-phosphate 3-epimerase [Candidatus Enterosoma sp.]MDY5649710.1 ribulose-phosphate 3-epimerase [Candidatus Enterosoma sp.]
MEKENLIRPSLLSADFSDLCKDIDEMISLNITHCHFDVMDGSFVSDISFGQPIYKSLVKRYQDRIVFDVHLMTLNPLKQVRSFIQAGSRDITFQIEAFNGEKEEIIELKKQFPDLKLGVAISPDTPFERVKEMIHLFDSILVMSVVPGKGGQKFIEGKEKKIEEINSYKKMHNLNLDIGVDGGINEITGPLCYLSGATYLVAGSFYFNKQDRKEGLRLIREKIGG